MTKLPSFFQSVHSFFQSSTIMEVAPCCMMSNTRQQLATWVRWQSSLFHGRICQRIDACLEGMHHFGWNKSNLFQYIYIRVLFFIFHIVSLLMADTALMRKHITMMMLQHIYSEVKAVHDPYKKVLRF